MSTALVSVPAPPPLTDSVQDSVLQMLPNDDTGSDRDSSDESEGVAASHPLRRQMLQRWRRPLREYLEEAMKAASSGRTFLETAAVTRPTKKS